MFDKRLIFFSGHYGSGKTSIAVSCAAALKERGEKVALADLDIVNPYFRAKDDIRYLADRGIEFIGSEYANSNVDLPALPQEIYSITDNISRRVVVDVGGDDRGAMALGRITPAVLVENNYEMLLVINKFRPLTATPEDVLQVKNEIEAACKIPFTGIVNNSNIGTQTSPEDILNSTQYAVKAAEICGLPVAVTTVNKELFTQLSGKITDLFPVELHNKNSFI